MKVGIVGVGNMGSAIAFGLINSSTFETKNLYLYNRTLAKLDIFSDKVNKCEEVGELINNSNIIVLAIKPNQYKEWLDKYSHLIQDKLLISIAAGISSKLLSKYTNLFLLSMPNIASHYQQGYTVVCENKFIDENILFVMLEEAVKIFKNIGRVKIIKEEEVEIYIGLIGSSPAYFFKIIKDMSKYFVQSGYEEEEIVQTLSYIMESSATLIKNKNEKTIDELIDSVCSEGGATIEAIKELEEAKLDKIFNLSINSCLNRAKNMNKEIL